MSDTPLPPSNIEAEEALIGSVLIDPGCWSDVGFVKSQDFYYEPHRWIWKAISGCVEADIELDIVTLQFRLEAEGRLASVGGPGYFARLLGNTPTSLHAVEYANIIRDQAYRRKLAALAGELAGAAYNPAKDPSSIVGSISEALKTRYNGSKPTTWTESSDSIRAIKWVWRQWLAKGILVLIAGESGCGKSQLALRIAASYTRGDPWPDGSSFEEETGSVLWAEGEAAQAIHIERARQWGLSLDRFVNLFTDEKTIDFELGNLEHRNTLAVRAQSPEIKAVIIDSLSGATGGRHEQDSEMLGSMKFLAGLARDVNKPLLITHHLRKKGLFDTDGINLDRLRGSSAIVQTARIVWAIDAPDPQAGDWRRLGVIKSNLDRFPKPIGMFIEPKGIRFGLAPEPPKVETVADKAADLLMALLSDEPISYKKIEEEFTGAAISEASINRAKKRLGIVAIKRPEGWYWSLPARGVYDT